MKLTIDAIGRSFSIAIAITLTMFGGCSRGVKNPDLQRDVSRLFDKQGHFVELHTTDDNYLVLVEQRDGEVTFSWGWSNYFLSMHGDEVKFLAEEYGVTIEKASESETRINQKIAFRGEPEKIVGDVTEFIPKFFEAVGDREYFLFTKNFDLKESDFRANPPFVGI